MIKHDEKIRQRERKKYRNRNKSTRGKRGMMKRGGREGKEEEEGETDR